MSDIADIEFIIFDKSSGRHAYKDVRARLHGRHFEVALCMHASLRANLLCRSVPADMRLGFDKARARELQWLFTDRRITAAEKEHAMDAMMSFATALGAQERDLRWDIPIPGAARQFAAQFASGKQPLVVISPCSSQRQRNYRNWSVENYAQTIDHLRKVHGCSIVLTGGPSGVEQEYGRRLSEAADNGLENRVNKTSLKELAALIDAADLVICPDSGPAHIATAVGTPVIGLYATSNPARTGPYVSRDLTVDRYPDAALKFLGKAPVELRWGQRVRHKSAMDLITFDDVRSKIDHFFAK